jgi:hypothetical protein
MTRTELALAASVLKPAAEWVRCQIRRDRENRYSLLRDWTLPAVRCSYWPDAVTGWQTPLFRISKLDRGVVSITIKAYQSTEDDNICDGATLSPDRLPGILPAALFHDPWYCRLPKDSAKQYEILADALGVPRKRLRSFGDNLFYSIAVAGGCPRWLAWAYHAGIRVGYPIVKPFLAAVLAAFLAVGCSGCVAPGDDGTFLDPGDYQPPEWEQVSP